MIKLTAQVWISAENYLYRVTSKDEHREKKHDEQNSTSTILDRLGYSRAKRMSSSNEIAYLSSIGSNNESSADESDHSIHLMTSHRKDNFLHLFKLGQWV